MTLNFGQHGLFKFVLIEQQGWAGFTTALQICAASMVVMFAGFAGGTQVGPQNRRPPDGSKRYSVR